MSYAYMKVKLGCRWDEAKGLYAVYQAVALQGEKDGFKEKPAMVIENWLDIPGNAKEVAKEVLEGATVMVQWEDGKGTCRVVTPQDVADAFWNLDRLRKDAENAGRLRLVCDNHQAWPVSARNEM